MESLGQACSTWLRMEFWTKCLPQQQPDWSIPLQFQILVAYWPFQSQGINKLKANAASQTSPHLALGHQGFKPAEAWHGRWNLKRKIVNILWQDNQIKTKRKQMACPICGKLFPVCRVYVHDTLTRPPQSRRMKSTFEKKLTLFSNIIIVSL